MFKPYFAFIGYRYTHVKRKNHFISFISLTSAIGIALGVGVLIAVLSVMNGFNKEIRAQMLSGTPHITVSKIGGTLFNWQAVGDSLKAVPEVMGTTPFIVGQGMITTQNQGGVQGVFVKGIDPKSINLVYPLSNRIIAGDLKQLKTGEYGIVVGKLIAQRFGLQVGDKISLIAPEASVTPAGIAPRIKRFTVIGVFAIGDLYDDKQVFIDLADANTFFRMKGSVTGLQIRIKDELDAPIISQKIQNFLSPEYWVSDWTREFGSFFKALQIQKTVMLFILLLIIAVAAFNLVSTLVMMVTDKRSDIAILRTMGASRRSIMGIFIAQGALIGFLGTLLGVILGLFLAYNVTGWVDTLQQTFNVSLVDKDVYLFGFLPSEIHFLDVLGIGIVTLIMSLLATLYPAYRAASIEPAEALRYE